MNGFETYRFASQTHDTDPVAIYGINPGPTKALIPIADSLRDRGINVIFRLAEPSKSEVISYFGDKIIPSSSNCTPAVAFTCGHIDKPKFIQDVSILRNTNPDLKIVTMDDNFDGTIPLIEQLVSLSLVPELAFIMNPLSQNLVRKLIAKPSQGKNNVVVTNNPSFNRFYEPGNSHVQVKREFREQMDIDFDQQVITFIGFPEGDYTDGYASHVYESFASAMAPVIDGRTVIYWPHGRGVDALPEEFAPLFGKSRIIFHPRSWWQENNIGIHKQLVSADIALMTNSTSSAEAFTAWGLSRHPMCIPIDITLLDDYPDLRVNETLRNYGLVRTISSRADLIAQIPILLENQEDWVPRNAFNRLEELQWRRKPLETVVDGLVALLY